MSDNSPKPFISRDKPKSWVLFVLGCLCGLLVAGPIAISGVALKIQLVKTIGFSLFFSCWAFGAVMFIIYTFSFVKGRYKDIEPRDWKEQIW